MLGLAEVVVREVPAPPPALLTLSLLDPPGLLTLPECCCMVPQRPVLRWGWF